VGISASTRRRISLAALFVNVIARIWYGRTPWLNSQAIRRVMTRVLPLPAPAKIRSGPSKWVAAACWAGVRSANKSEVIADRPGAIVILRNSLGRS
jgi:hypothetical protein